MALVIRHRRVQEAEFVVDQIMGSVGTLERWEVTVAEFRPSADVVMPPEREVARLTLWPGSALHGAREAFVRDEIDLPVFEAVVSHVLDRIYDDAFAEAESAPWQRGRADPALANYA